MLVRSHLKPSSKLRQLSLHASRSLRVPFLRLVRRVFFPHLYMIDYLSPVRTNQSASIIIYTRVACSPEWAWETGGPRGRVSDVRARRSGLARVTHHILSEAHIVRHILRYSSCNAATFPVSGATRYARQSSTIYLDLRDAVAVRVVVGLRI